MFSFNKRCRMKRNIDLRFVSRLRMNGAVHRVYVVMWCCLIDPFRINPKYARHVCWIRPDLLVLSPHPSSEYTCVTCSLMFDLFCMSRVCYIPGKIRRIVKHEVIQGLRLMIAHTYVKKPCFLFLITHNVFRLQSSHCKVECTKIIKL